MLHFSHPHCTYSEQHEKEANKLIKACYNPNKQISKKTQQYWIMDHSNMCMRSAKTVGQLYVYQQPVFKTNLHPGKNPIGSSDGSGIEVKADPFSF